MRVVLSGMPELRLGLNDKVIFQQSAAASEDHFLCFVLFRLLTL